MPSASRHTDIGQFNHLKRRATVDDGKEPNTKPSDSDAAICERSDGFVPRLIQPESAPPVQRRDAVLPGRKYDPEILDRIISDVVQIPLRDRLRHLISQVTNAG
jgi:hypothetical protein